jgi:hypothetical protein
MSMRKHPVVYLALFIALGGTAYAAVGAAAASAGRRSGHRSALPGCYPKGSTTIAQDKTGRFYSSGDGPKRRWYVCGFSQGMPRKIYRFPFGQDPAVSPSGPSAKVAGRYVAFVFYGLTGFCGSSGHPGASRVWVVDMLTGQRTFSETLTGGENFPGPGNDLVLKPDGSAAWVTSDRCSGATIFSVNRHDSTGTASVDSGPQIDPRSLAAGGSWLYWTNAGSPRSAPFH